MCACVCQFVKSFDEEGVAANSRTVRLLLDALNDLFGFQLTDQRARMLVQVRKHENLAGFSLRVRV